MSNASTVLTTVTPAERDSGAKSREPPNGVNILLVIIYGAMAGVMCVLFVQRLLLRIAPKYSKGYTDVTKHAPKNLKDAIHKRLMQTMNIYYEPVLLLNDDHRQQTLLTHEASTPYNYLYRMKVLDHMKKFEDILSKHDKTLKRPCRKDLAQHLRDMKPQTSGVLNSVRPSQMKMLADSYEHARYKPEAFDVEDYERFSEIFAEVMATLDQKTKKKRSGKKIPGRKNTNTSSRVPQSSGSSHLDTEPLIRGSLTTRS